MSVGPPTPAGSHLPRLGSPWVNCRLPHRSAVPSWVERLLCGRSICRAVNVSVRAARLTRRRARAWQGSWSGSSRFRVRARHAGAGPELTARCSDSPFAVSRARKRSSRRVRAISGRAALSRSSTSAGGSERSSPQNPPPRRSKRAKRESENGWQQVGSQQVVVKPLRHQPAAQQSPAQQPPASPPSWTNRDPPLAAARRGAPGGLVASQGRCERASTGQALSRPAGAMVKLQL